MIVDLKKIQKVLIKKGYSQNFHTVAFCEYWLNTRGIRVWSTGEARTLINGNVINKDFDPSESEVEQKIMKWFFSL